MPKKLHVLPKTATEEKMTINVGSDILAWTREIAGCFEEPHQSGGPEEKTST